VLDRLGKGRARTAPRDAMISMSADENVLGRAFGIHRALDTVGALLGPLAAFILLAQIPHGYKSIFLVSACISLIGLAILILFVRNPEGAEDRAERGPRVSVRAAAGLLGRRDVSSIVIAGSALGLMTISDGFVYLVLQRSAGIDPRWFPLLYLGTAFFIPRARHAVRQPLRQVGRARVFLGGYILLVLMYVLLAVFQPRHDHRARLPRAARCVLRRHRRRPHGARQHGDPRAPPHERPRDRHHRDVYDTARGLDPVRCDLGGVRPRGIGEGLPGRPRDRPTALRIRALSVAGSRRHELARTRLIIFTALLARRGDRLGGGRGPGVGANETNATAPPPRRRCARLSRH
jgi:hypothetical protein